MNRISPSELYMQFREAQIYITDRQYDSHLHSVLMSIIATQNFEIEDYKELYNNLRRQYGYHIDHEAHYKAAIEHHNNSAWKSIEKYLGRKPYLVDRKRCYQGFEFQITRKEYYRCTGWNEKGNIKFIYTDCPENRFSKPTFKKLLNFNYEQFKDFFKDKKMYKF